MADGTVKIGVELDEQGLAEKIAKLGSAMEEAFSAALSDLGAASIDAASFTAIGTSMSTAVATGVRNSLNQIKQAMNTAISAAKSAKVSGFDSIGKNMCAGVAEGIRNGTSSITAAINAAAAAARAAFQEAMKIKSPSRVMMEDGENVSKGVAVGVIQGIPAVEAAMEMLADAMIEASQEGTESLTRSRVEMIQSEIDAIDKILDEYQAMLDEKQAAKELADKHAAVKNAKNKKDREKAQEELNEHLKKLENERLKDQRDFLKAELDAYEKNVQTLVDFYDFMSDQIIVALKNRYEGEREMQMERLEAEYKAATDAADALFDYQKKQSDAYLSMLEETKDAEIQALNDRIDALNAETKAERDAAREKADAEKISALQAEVARAKNAKFRNEAQKALDEELEKQAQAQRERDRQAEIDAMKDQISDIKDNYDEQRKLEEQRIDEIEEAHKLQTQIIKDNYEQQKKATEQHYKELLSADRLNAEARRLLLEESNEEMIELLESYNPEWYNAGKTFGELFVEALDVQMDNVHRLIEEAASFAQNKLDLIKAQIAEMSSGASSVSVPEATNSASGNKDYYYTSISASTGGSGIVQNNTVNINQQVKSPAETSYAVSKSLKEAAYGI